MKYTAISSPASGCQLSVHKQSQSPPSLLPVPVPWPITKEVSSRAHSPRCIPSLSARTANTSSYYGSHSVTPCPIHGAHESNHSCRSHWSEGVTREQHRARCSLQSTSGSFIHRHQSLTPSLNCLMQQALCNQQPWKLIAPFFPFSIQFERL